MKLKKIIADQNCHSDLHRRMRATHAVFGLRHHFMC